MDAQVYAGTSPTKWPPRPASAAEPPAESAPHRLTFDIRDADAMRDVLADVTPEIVFHLAAVGVTNLGVDPALALTVNAGGVINLLEALRRQRIQGCRVERIVLVGTGYEYGTCGREVSAPRKLDPLNAYAASKVAAWAFGRMYWQAYELPVVTVRPFQVYGPGQPERTLIPAAISAALSGEDFPMTPGEQERDFIFALDVADGMIATAETAGIEGASLDLGTGVGTPVRRVVQQIWKLADAEGSIRPGAHPYRTGAAVHLVADADHTAQLTGWRAKTRLEEGLRITMKRSK
jgi:nucleoside-diphosphate-sugar epimerase